MNLIRRFAAFFLCTVLLFANDGWKLPVQIYAWTQMFADNVQTMSVSDALVKTFDGQAPCRLCKKLRGGGPSQMHEDHRSASVELPEFILPLIPIATPNFEIATAYTPYIGLHSLWDSEKPKRPPRIGSSS